MRNSIVLSLLCLALAGPALAAPPDHAPAWGNRAKQNGEKPGKGRHRGYTGTEWNSDYGVLAGRCNTEEILTVVGAAAGAVIGNRTAEREDRTVATLAGALIGGLVGNRIGDAIDDRDRACMGQSLELVPVGSTVVWFNPATKVGYHLRPVRDLRGGCRLFEARLEGRKAAPVQLTACRHASGVWGIRSA